MGRKKKSTELELYSAEQLETVEKHIEKNFGKIYNYFIQNDPTDIKTDIAVIEPTRERPYFTLVTKGMGAHLMNVPENLADRKLRRAELVICLPANWDPDNEQHSGFWALDLLCHIARLPVREKSWLGWGHSIDFKRPLTVDTELNSIVLISPAAGKESWFCELPDGDEVNFYQVIPLYSSEIEFKNSRGTDALLNAFGSSFSPVVYTDRPELITDRFKEIIDTVEDHSSKIVEKGLDLDEINGANHISAFFRWCMAHGLLDPEFTEFMADELDLVRTGKLDVRKFLINYMNGELTVDVFSEEGRNFAQFYYDFYSPVNRPSYPSDVDDMALEYFGEERYNSDEFQDEAYLFVPFDEEYYKAISRYIALNYDIFRSVANETE